MINDISSYTGLTSVSVNFTPIADPAICYLIYVKHKGHPVSSTPYTLTGKDGTWLQAAGWFNPAGNAFWDDRPTSVGPPVPIIPYTNNNIVRADGTQYEGCIGVFRKVKTATGGFMEFVEFSPNFFFTAPNLENGTTTTTTTPVVSTTTTTTTTTSTTKRGRNK